MATTPPTAPTNPISTPSSAPSPPTAPPPASSPPPKAQPRTKSTASSFAVATPTRPHARPASTTPSLTSPNCVPTRRALLYGSTFVVDFTVKLEKLSPKSMYDNCLLRYSNLRIFYSPDESHDFCMSDAKSVSDPTLFFKTLNGLMGSLINRAVLAEMFATGDVAVNGTQRLYGLVQCTRDLSGDSCADCLQDAIGEIPVCCAGKIGGRAVGASCNVRYEVYRFYGNSSIRAAFGGSPPPLPPPPTTTMIAQKRSKKNKLKIALLIIIPVILSLVIISVAFACLRKKKIIMKNEQSHQEVHQITDIDPLVFDLAMLRIATNDFSNANKLGEGGFGVVYKGTLADGQEIAVKRLSKTSGQGLGELRNEVVLVTRLQHRNLVRLLGCCLEEQERLLIYEFIPNKSLDKFLFDPINIRQLTWERRYKIIEGIARGLLYLHEDSQLRIIHRDLKASNILLDKDMNPKISDFGLAKLFKMDQTQGNTSRVVGTYGYMAPEYALCGHFSIKSDVFSFGVLVLEIMTGWRSNQFYAPDNTTDLLSYVWKFWVEGRALQLISPSMGDLSRGKAMRCMHIALLCVQEDAMDRPNMSSVVLMLSSHSTSLTVPSHPAFYVGDSTVRLPDIENTTPDRSIATTKSKSVSVNDVSITELEPR